MSDQLGNSATRVLLAVVDGCRSVREVAARVGLSTTYTFSLLRLLRGMGLVAWEPNTEGTLRALVAESHEHMYASDKLGEKSSGPGAVRPAPDLPNAPRRR